MVHFCEVSILTEQYQQVIPITEKIKEAVADAKIRQGTATVVSKHTTTGITVNENLECMLQDMEDLFNSWIPEEAPYHHARLLRSYGATAGNPTGHLKSMLSGYHAVFPVQKGEIVLGGAQDIFFLEFDGPSQRTYTITVMGE